MRATGLHHYYTDYGLTALCPDCVQARQEDGEYVQWAETPARRELAGLVCYDCDSPPTDEDGNVICHSYNAHIVGRKVSNEPL